MPSVKNKICPGSAAAVAEIPDGATILLGGFGGVGVPENLLAAMADHPARELTIVSNHAGYGEHGLAVLFRQRKVSKLICSYAFHPTAFVFREMYMAGKIELEQIPQGDRLDPKQLMADLCSYGRNAEYLLDVDSIVTHVAANAREGDVVCVLSNGGFGGIHEKLLKALGD